MFNKYSYVKAIWTFVFTSFAMHSDKWPSISDFFVKLGITEHASLSVVPVESNLIIGS